MKSAKCQKNRTVQTFVVCFLVGLAVAWPGQALASSGGATSAADLLCPDDITIACDASTAPSNTGEPSAPGDADLTYEDEAVMSDPSCVVVIGQGTADQFAYTLLNDASLNLDEEDDDSSSDDDDSSSKSSDSKSKDSKSSKDDDSGSKSSDSKSRDCSSSKDDDSSSKSSDSKSSDDSQSKDDIEDCCEGGVNELTLKYTGAETVLVEVKSKDDVVFSDVLSEGDEFNFTGTGKDSKLKSNTKIYMDGEFAVAIHTSCSKPIYPGLVAGDFVVVSGHSVKGGELCYERNCLGHTYGADEAERLGVGGQMLTGKFEGRVLYDLAGELTGENGTRLMVTGGRLDFNVAADALIGTIDYQVDSETGTFYFYHRGWGDGPENSLKLNGLTSTIWMRGNNWPNQEQCREDFAAAGGLPRGIDLGAEIQYPPPFCDYTLYRTWAATDAEGHTASCTQVIRVEDEDEPPPSVEIVNCSLRDNVLIQSTGTNTWNIRVEHARFLVPEPQVWLPTVVNNKVYADGIFDLDCEMPAAFEGKRIFFRVVQYQ